MCSSASIRCCGVAKNARREKASGEVTPVAEFGGFRVAHHGHNRPVNRAAAGAVRHCEGDWEAKAGRHVGVIVPGLLGPTTLFGCPVLRGRQVVEAFVVQRVGQEARRSYAGMCNEDVLDMMDMMC